MQGDIPYWGANSIQDYVDAALVTGPTVLIGEDGAPFFDRTKPVAFFVDEPIWPNNHIHVLKMRKGVDPRWLTYALNCVDYSRWITGSTRDKLTQGDLMQIAVPGVDVAEQRAIADFLDRETAQIDAMIEAQGELVDRLEERKAAISTSIIWGSGAEGGKKVIEPAPEVPEHWQVLRNKFVYQESDELSSADDGELLTVSHITGVTLRSEKVVTMTEAESTEGYRVVRLNDLVINTLWGWMGALGVSSLNGIVSPAYGVYRPTIAGVDPTFMHHLYRSAPYVCEIGRRSTGIWSSRLRIYPKTFLDMPTILPPLDEQHAIGSRLADATRGMNTLISAATRAIALLQERRSALVSAAVTGRIDPRIGRETVADKALESA